MKKIALGTSILLVGLALGSCYWRPDFSSGGLSLDVSGVTSKAVGEVVRVYLIADGLLFSTGGGVPFTAEISGEDEVDKVISVEGLPVGPTYKAMVGWGPVSGGVFKPRFYGESPLFTIAPNAKTAVTVNTDWVPYYADISFSSDLLGRKLTGIVDDYSYLYVAEASRVYYVYYSVPDIWYIQDSYDLATDPGGQGVSSIRINGLSKGYLYGNSYIDGNDGILPFWGGEGWSFDRTFTQALGGPRDIQGSGSFAVSGTATDYTVFFRRDGGLGGTYVPSADSGDPALWKWANIDVAGSSDLAVSGYNAYFAADGAVFALPPTFLQDTTPTLAEHRVDLPAPAPTKSLGFRPIIAAAGGTLTLGTTDGVWQAGVTESVSSPYVTVSSGPTQVAGTEGDSIERIAINSYNSSQEAYLSRYYLYLWNSGLYKIPFFAVAPGRVTGMAWDSNGTLYLAGTEGLSAVYVGFC